MKIDVHLLQRLCELAELEIPEEEIPTLLSDFQRMVDFVQKIQEVPVEGVEPLIFMTEGYQTLREDTAAPPVDPTPLLANAPDHDDTYVRVPKFTVKT
ncbi:MAG: Asp-tRNA(Asn)/Glu-tRNA(Gln) amidotransferase subunit GatC [Bacteroidia bacterium]